MKVTHTYGYITKNTRIEDNLHKEHYIDVRCISGNPKAVSDGTKVNKGSLSCKKIKFVETFQGYIKKER
ncbi:MAG: hypothetical protein K6G26_11115 [Lachnospiraceae bacterium]|nr:hypothetical protein [Lachnospiraceae bacterium]